MNEKIIIDKIEIMYHPQKINELIPLWLVHLLTMTLIFSLFIEQRHVVIFLNTDKTWFIANIIFFYFLLYIRQYLSIANLIKIRLYIPLVKSLNNGLFFCTKVVYHAALLVNIVLSCEWLVLHCKKTILLDN